MLKIAFSVAISLAAISGCSAAPATAIVPSNSNSNSNAVASDSESKDTRFDDLTMYADSLRQPGDRSVWSAREEVVSTCLAAAGIRYVPSPYPGGAPPRVRYEYPNPQLVQRYGYEATAHQPNMLVAPTSSQIPDSELSIRDACNQKASKELEEDRVNEIRDLIAQANQTMGSRVVASPSYQAAIAKWSSCMAGRGFHYASMKQAMEAAGTARGSGPTPARPALDIANADFECQHNVKLIELTHSIMADEVTAWVDANKQTLDDYTNAVRSLDSRAQAVLAGG